MYSRCESEVIQMDEIKKALADAEYRAETWRRIVEDEMRSRYRTLQIAVLMEAFLIGLLMAKVFL